MSQSFPSGTAFRRSNMLVQAMQALMAASGPSMGKIALDRGPMMQLMNDSAYKSRGKGGGGKPRAHYSFIAGDMRRYRNANKSVVPTPVKSGLLKSIPHRVWVMDCYVFGDGTDMMESKSRSALARLLFHKKLGRSIKLSFSMGEERYV